MTQSPAIICKPTPWFLFRAAAMLLMFSVFAVLFFRDGTTGYRRKNLEFYLHQAFQEANDEFSRLNADGSLTPEAWRDHAARQVVKLPADRSLLPSALATPLPWPEILHDYPRMKPLQWNLLWREYSKQHGLNATPMEEPYSAKAIRDQIIVAWICTALAAAAAFVLIRTLRRSITADDHGVVGPSGRRIAYQDMTSLDLRKWDSKGLAFITYQSPAGAGRLRIDGLTYGGFKPEHDEPAEQLMRRIRDRFSGEIIEYAPLAEITAPNPSHSENP